MTEAPSKNTLSILSLVFAGISVIVLPPLFGLAAFILGLIAAVKKERLGILALVLSIVLPILGLIFGFLVGATLFDF